MKSTQTIADDFLKNASSQLAEGSQWLHDHHDWMFNKEHSDLNVDDIVGLMIAACISDKYDANLYFLITHIRLPDSDGISLDYPKDLIAAIRDNKQQDEPPSLNLHHRVDLARSMSGSKHNYTVRFDSDQVPQHLPKCGIIVTYNTFPLSDTYTISPDDPTDPTWSRSISLTHCPEIRNL